VENLRIAVDIVTPSFLRGFESTRLQPRRTYPFASLTAPGSQDYLLNLLGKCDVQRFRWALVLVLLASAVCVSTVARPDLPETNFNEADAPVNLAPPVRLGGQVIAPAIDPVVISPTLPIDCAASVVSRLALEPTVAPKRRHPLSLHDLLCTFLI
jgi:hypothetical protein